MGTYANRTVDTRPDKEKLAGYARENGFTSGDYLYFPTSWMDSNLRNRLETAKVIERVGTPVQMRSYGIAIPNGQYKGCGRAVYYKTDVNTFNR